MRIAVKTLFLATTLLSTTFGMDRNPLDPGADLSPDSASPSVLAPLETRPTECPCRAEKRKKEAEENRKIGREYLPWEAVQSIPFAEWKEPVRASIFAAVDDFSKISDVIIAINAAVDGIWGFISEIQERHPEMTPQMHYGFMTCYLGRISQKNESDAVVESLNNLLKQHRGYAGIEKENPDSC